MTTKAQEPASPGPTIAIVGSGPSGCYTANFLRKDLPGAEITVFEALPVPYGLVRYGVAADHQGTKAVAAQFDRMFTRNAVTFVGNTRIGLDVDAAAITEAFDVVVVATGLMRDRGLSVPQDAGANVVGAGQILRSLNAFPDAATPEIAPLTAPLGKELIVVGHGNVAIDVVRLLTKQPRHFSGSDVDDGALALLRPTSPTSVRVIGRSSAENAKFDLAMVRELCALDTVRIAVEGLADDASGHVAELLRTAAQPTSAAGDDATTVTFQFNTVPVAVRTEYGGTVFDVRRFNGEPARYRADTVITAIGFCHGEDAEKALTSDPWTASHVYRVGWAGRGGRGNIAENRKFAQQVAKSIVDDLHSGHLPQGRPGLAAVRPHLSRAVDFAGWQAIDDAERAAADTQRSRRKITDLQELVALARAGAGATTPAPR